MIVCSQQLEVLKTCVLVMICMMLVTDVCNLPYCEGKAESGHLAQTTCAVMKYPEPDYIIIPYTALEVSAVTYVCNISQTMHWGLNVLRTGSTVHQKSKKYRGEILFFRTVSTL